MPFRNSPFLRKSWKNALWGNRDLWGLEVREDDPDWKEWQRTYMDFYLANQREGVGTTVNDAGYKVMSRIDLTGKTVLEIGPGDIRHMKYWEGKPERYVLVDIDEGMLNSGAARLEEIGVKTERHLLRRGEALPIAPGSIDVIITFYSLEHIYPLSPYLAEMSSLLRFDGVLIGAVPAEGGLAWGGGRMITSRRWMNKNTAITPDKIICWEHPNYADRIVHELDSQLDRLHMGMWPFGWLPIIDLNLIVRFMYKKRT